MLVDSNLNADQQALLARALTMIADAILITDRQGHIIWANEAFSSLCGYSFEEMMGQSLSILKSGKQCSEFYQQLWQTILSGKVWHCDVVNRKKDGSFYTAEEIITPLFDSDGQITHFIATQHDITLRKQESGHQHYLAYHDCLTGLPNRAMIMDQLNEAIEHKNHHMLAVMFIDLDHFKPVNDSFGHHVGDLLLTAVAQRLSAATRKTDIVARLGGDEFIVVVNWLSTLKPVESLANKLIGTLCKPYWIARHKINISASIGISVCPNDGSDSQLLLERADLAMYRAKESGRNAWRFYVQSDFEI